jgi:two-component system chemotaxis sensor kinase CheA
MFEYFKKRITAQIALIMVLISLCPLAFVLWFLNDNKSDEIYENHFNNLQILYKKTVEQVENQITLHQQFVQSIAKNPGFLKEYENVQNGNTLSHSFENYLDAVIKQQSYYDVLILDTTGKIVYTLKKENDLNQNVRSRSLRQTSLAFAFNEVIKTQKSTISTLRYYFASNQQAAFVAVPIFKDEQLEGVLAVQINKEFLFELINSHEGFGKTGEIVAAELRDDGAIVATIELKHDKKAFENQRVLNKQSNDIAISYALKQKNGFGVVNDYRGKKVLAVWGFAPTVRWGVVVKSDEAELFESLKKSNEQILYLFVFVALLVALAIIYSSRSITKPILELVKAVQAFSASKQHAVSTIVSKNEIGLLNKEFQTMSLEIQEQFQKLQEQAVWLEEQAEILEEQTKKIEQHNKTLELEVAKRTQELKHRNEKVESLLNNSGQGFLLFSNNLLVENEYSQECKKIFKQDIAQQNIAQLLYANEKEQNSFLKALDVFFASSQTLQKESILSLLDGEIVLFNRYIKLEFKMINAQTIMLILTNITKQRELEKRISNERNILTFITMVLKDKTHFFEYMDEFDVLLDFIEEKIAQQETLSLTNASKLYRKIHTYKGMFLQYSLPKLPMALHDIETKLWEKIVHNQEKQSHIALDLKELDALKNAKEEDLNYLKNALGENFLNSKHDISISKNYLETLETFALNIQKLIDIKSIDNTTKQGFEILNTLRYCSLKSLLATYPNLCLQIAASLEKEIEPFEIQGDDILIDPKKYSDFTKVLVHIFRNALDHGIESYETRLESQKSEIAEISCVIKDNTDSFEVCISDDGCGIDIESIKQKALQKQLFNEDELQGMSKDEILSIIFHDGFTTKQSVTTLSGRGVGLAAIKEEVDKLRGKIVIESIVGEGTKFIFIIPKI